jgi:hypothetical protein
MGFVGGIEAGGQEGISLMAEDLRTALHHLCHVSHAYRGTVQMYESNQHDFTVVVEFPESQMSLRGPEAVVPFLAEVRKRFMTTNPDAICEAKDYQPLQISGGFGSTPQYIHRLFVTVKDGNY